MDSITQIVLGAAVGEVVLGKKVGNKAMLWGAIAGTIPDLDVYQRFFFETLRANELHRGFSHSLLFSLGFAPIMAWLIKKKEKFFLLAVLALILGYPFITIDNSVVRLILGGVYALLAVLISRSSFNSKLATRRDWSKLVFWALVTHPLLDCHTTWGTQFLWPLPYKLAWNNIFVVDPVYTIPFLIFVAVAMFYNRQSRTRQRLNWIGIGLSSLYMMWTFAVKWHVHTIFARNFKEQDIEYTRITTVPTPFNSILWVGTADVDTAYHVGLYSILDKDKNISLTEVDKNDYLIDSIKDESTIQRLKVLSKNWYIIKEDSGGLSFIDIRYGPMFKPESYEPDYMFGYDLRWEGGELKAEQQEPPTGEVSKALYTLVERLKGK
jgi:inner membrane protein